MTRLFVHSHEVEIIPGLDDLSVVDANNRNPGKLDWSLSRSSSPELAFMLATHRATRHDLVTFSDHVLDDDHYVRKRLAEGCIERPVTTRTLNRVRRIIRQAMSNAILVEQLLDHLVASVIPDLVKPAAD